jgi:uncharacterized phage protein (TIGR02218 family)
MSVDNLEVTGALQEGDVALFDLSAADIEAGMFDNAEVTTFLVNADDPNLYQHVLRTGWLGNVTREAEGQYKTELRGLTQALSQGIVRTYSLSCDAELGDARCKADTTAVTMTNTVAVVTNRRVFQVVSAILGTIPAHLVPGSLVTWTSGLNTGYRMEVKSYAALVLTLYQPMPADIQVGDTFIHRGACDKTISTCINTYNNLLNFRGHAIFVPGQNEILKVGKR